MTFDLVVANGMVVDGTGAPGYRADVGVVGETIGAIGDLGRAESGQVIDAAGLVVAPGFIDPHTHAEGALLTDPQHAMGLRQGITTEFLGIDGMSYAPLSVLNYRLYRRWLAGVLGEPPEDLDMSSVAAFRRHYHRRVAVNTAYLVRSRRCGSRPSGSGTSRSKAGSSPMPAAWWRRVSSRGQSASRPDPSTTPAPGATPRS